MYYERLADLPLEVSEHRLERRERETSSGFSRVTTTFVMEGPGSTVGKGEDVVYDEVDHERLAADPPDLPTGSFTVDEFSQALEDVSLFPTDPERETAHHYRRWATESAALDLALRQAETDLASALESAYHPLSFVVSTRFEDEVEADERLARFESIDPGVRFKLDPSPEWSADLIEYLADTGRVRILDLKGLYDGVDVGFEPDADFYGQLLDAFPEAVFEDAGTTPETRPVLEPHADRLSWDYPITGVESVEALPFEPEWLNIKPSRFGTIRSLFATIEWAQNREIDLYAGGQFELGVGRGHVQAIASVCFPDGPNDIAPRGYNDPEPALDLPRSPLDPPADPVGLGF